METNRPKSVKHEMRGRKLKSVVYWQGASKQKGVKQVARKTRTISSQLHVPVALSPEKKSHIACGTGGWVGPKTNLNILQKEENCCPQL